MSKETDKLYISQDDLILDVMSCFDEYDDSTKGLLWSAMMQRLNGAIVSHEFPIVWKSRILSSLAGVALASLDACTSLSHETWDQRRKREAAAHRLKRLLSS